MFPSSSSISQVLHPHGKILMVTTGLYTYGKLAYIHMVTTGLYTYGKHHRHAFLHAQ